MVQLMACRRRLEVALLVPVLLVGLCGAGRVVVPVDPERLPAPGAARADAGGGDARGDVEAIAAILARDLGLPLPARLRVFVYESRAAFRQGLLADGDVPAHGVDELAAFAVGVARQERVLLNGRVRTSRTEWLRLVAHELTHVAQFELARGEGRGEQWLAEGLAEHVAFQALERLGLDSLAGRAERARERVRTQPALAQARLDLPTLGSQRGFTLRHQREGSVETYQLAFLMTDYLIRREGFERVVEYFRLVGRHDRATAFVRAFGQTLSAFEQEVLAHLQRIVPQGP
jgi:hypothetical protein